MRQVRPIPCAGGLFRPFRPWVLPLSLLVFPSSAAKADGLGVVALPQASQGTLRVQIALLQPTLAPVLARPDASGFLQAVLASGSGQVRTVVPLAGGGEPVFTVLAFDQTGSFKPYWKAALDLAGSAIRTVPQGPGIRQVRVVTFGQEMRDQGTFTTSTDVVKVLDGLASVRPDQDVTRLKSFILDAGRGAAHELPLTAGGLRQVVVFTDGDDESKAYDVETLAHELRGLGVRVHVVGFYSKGAGGKPSSRTIAQGLDDMKRLAEATGGIYVQVDDPAVAAAPLGGALVGTSDLYWVDLAFCGIPSGPALFEDKLSLVLMENGQRSAWTPALPFTQNAAGPALEPCKTAPLPPAVADAPPSPAMPRWVGWVLGGLGLLSLLLLLLLLLRRRRPAPPVAPVVAPAPPPAVPPPPAPAPAPVVDPSPAPVPVAAPAWRDPFLRLPETHLVLRKGPPGSEPFYRIHRSPFLVGGDSGSGVDLILDIPQVSSRHATLHLYPRGDLWVVDEGSSNGTFLDGRRLPARERVPVKPGQILAFSKHAEFMVQQPDRAGLPVPTHVQPPMSSPAAPPDPVSAAAFEPPPRRRSPPTTIAPLGPPADDPDKEKA